jgi:CRISPR-associated protein Cmr3
VSENGWKPFRLTPDDVLFFRDGRPSTQGDDHYLRSLFPPLPSTLYGAVRTRRLLDKEIELQGLDDAATWSQRVDSLQDEIGPWGGFGSLELRGPWLLRGDEALLPAPFDLALVLEEPTRNAGNEGELEEEDTPPRIATVLRYRLPDAPPPAGQWSHALSLPALYERTGDAWREWKTPSSEQEPELPAGWFLKPAGVRLWMDGRLPEPGHFVHARELWMDELRTGVGLEEARRSSKDGQLYTFGFVRLRPGVGIGFETRGTVLKACGGVLLGGEGRTARLETGPPFPVPDAPRLSGPRFRISFSTPALSATGAYPPGFPAASKAEWEGYPCQLLSAIVRGSMAVGGWDLARKRAKPLRRAVPPGSVHFLKASDPGAANDLATKLHGSSRSDFAEEHLSRQGFGLTLVAADD